MNPDDKSSPAPSGGQQSEQKKSQAVKVVPVPTNEAQLGENASPFPNQSSVPGNMAAQPPPPLYNSSSPLNQEQASNSQAVQLNTQHKQYFDEEMQQEALQELAPIPPLPVPRPSQSSSLTTGAPFPSIIGAGTDYALMPIPLSSANYFRSMGVPSRVYSCSAPQTPSQPGQFFFKLLPSPATTTSGQERPTFALINIRTFNINIQPPMNFQLQQSLNNNEDDSKDDGKSVDSQTTVTRVNK